MTPSPSVTVRPPEPRPMQVVHLDTLDVELPFVGSPEVRFIGSLQLRGAAHQLPACIVRRGTL